jgi:pyruvate-formate lyase-activating enzyme
MEQKYFPIKTATACQLKWTWSTIHLYAGRTSSCHRVGTTPITVNNFDQFHNTEKKLNDRTLMLDGEWPTGGCEYCQNIEESGGQSDRQFQLQIPNLAPPELDTDSTAINVTPRILEVYLDNVCNMSCIYCHDGFSSRIQKENERFGDFQRGGIEIKNLTVKPIDSDQIIEKFWSWMEKNYHHLRRFHVLGGEPFYQPAFERCLQFLENHSNPDLEFNIVSNLKVSKTKMQEYIERIKRMVVDRRIKRFDLTCSIDCWGSEQEYIRHGINLEDWKKNFDYVANQRWIYLNINQTITGLGVKSIPDLIEFINSYKQRRQIDHYFMTCVNRLHLHPGIFGKGFFDKDMKNILNAMNEDSWQEKNAKNMMTGLWLEWNSHQRDNTKISDLKIFLDEMDRRRNTNWQEIFPWLIKEFDHVV